MRYTQKHGGVWTLLFILGLVACGVPLPAEEQAAPAVGQSTQEEQELGSLPGSLRWSREIDGARRYSLGGEGLVSDRHGGVLLWVNFTGTTDLGGGPVTAPPEGGVGLASYDSEGRLKWSRVLTTLGGARLLDARALAVDSHRNLVLVVFAFAGSGTGPGEVPLFPGFNLVKVDPRAERVLWARPFRVDLGINVTRLVTDNDDHIALAGFFSGTVDFGSGPHTTSSTVSSSLLARFNSQGENLWTYADEGHFSTAHGLAVDSKNNLVLSGGLFAGTPSDTFVMMFSPSGDVRWSRRIVGTDGVALEVGVRDDRVVAVGSYFHSITFAGQTLPPPGPGGGFVAAYTHEGEERWIRRLGHSGGRIALDAKGCLFVSGTYEDGNDVGLGPATGIPGSSTNVYVAKLDRDDGAVRWVRTFPAGPVSVPISLALTTKNRPVLLGVLEEGTIRVDDEVWSAATKPYGSLFLLGFNR
ncbi:PQQ-binding-like beta-propeller repeat protein [Archangium gephyra]|uniref:outer membrane protein assembly factor BamB family protein n=1 Tax=Archangium gephyra TaxID=48 RepID=UPI0035D41181